MYCSPKIFFADRIEKVRTKVQIFVLTFHFRTTKSGVIELYLIFSSNNGKITCLSITPVIFFTVIETPCKVLYDKEEIKGGETMPTIKDVANYTGVSPTTVSNVIHGRTTKVSAETKLKVEQALKELKYHSNMAGRLLAKNGSRIIGVIFQDDRAISTHTYDNPYLGEFIQAVETAIREAGYFMMFQRVSSVDDGVKLVQMWDLEGVVLSGTSPKDLSEWTNSLKIPIVFLDMYPQKEADILNIGVDDLQASYEMTHYLVSKGHQEIAFIAFGKSFEDWIGVDEKRAQGVKKALAEHQLKPNYFSAPNSEEAFAVFIQAFAKKHAGHITALFFASDLMAVRAQSVLSNHGWHIPDDFSIAGFDGTLLAKLATPQITTVYQNILQKAEKGIQLLLADIRGQQLTKRTIQITTTFIEGQSVKKIK